MPLDKLCIPLGGFRVSSQLAHQPQCRASCSVTMFRAKPFSYVSTLLHRKSRASLLSNRGTCIQPNRLRTQIATLVHVTTIQESNHRNPKQSSAVQVTHRHPSAHASKQKTYDVDVVFADDEDGDEDVCWTFQIMEGEDTMNRLSAYAQAFERDGSGDDDYDQYVTAFRRKLGSIAGWKLLMDRPGSTRRKEEAYGEWDKGGLYELVEEPDEGELGEVNGVHRVRVDEERNDK